MYKNIYTKPRLLFENFGGDRVALDRWWPRREGTSLDVNSYNHDWGANGSKPIHMQHFYRNVDACSSENNLSLHLCICAGVGARLCLHNTEMSDRVAWFRSAQAQKVHRGMKRSTEGDSSTEIPKAGPEQRLNPFMRGLFLCCEWQMHVWTPAVSKCLFTGCKSAASKLKDFQSSSTLRPSPRQ